MKKTFRSITTVLLIVWSILVIGVLSFGVPIASKISKTFTAIYQEKLRRDYKIQDIEITNLEELYITNQEFQLDFKVKARKQKNFELVFKSLDPDIFTVSSVGIIKGVVFEGKETEGRLEVKSKVDPAYLKIFTIKFYNTFPEEFDVKFQTSNKTSEFVEGIGMNISVIIPNKDQYTYKKLSVEVDEEVFKKVSNSQIIPLKSIDKTTIKCKIGDVEIEKVVSVSPFREDLIPNTIKLTPPENDNYRTCETIGVSVLNDDTPTLCNYVIRPDKDAGLVISSANRISFNKTGEKTIYVDIVNLHGEVIKTLSINVTIDEYVEEIVMSLIPSQIELLQGSEEKITIKLPRNTKIINEISTCKVSYSYSEKVLSIVDTTIGEKTITLEMTYQGELITKDIKIIVNKNITEIEYVKKDISWSVFKVMGHMGLFMMEGIIMVCFLVFHHHKKFKGIDILIFILLGFFLGGITEFIQIYLPNRGPSFKDVWLDFEAYLIGGTAAATLLLIGYFIKTLTHKKHESKK